MGVALLRPSGWLSTSQKYFLFCFLDHKLLDAKEILKIWNFSCLFK